MDVQKGCQASTISRYFKLFNRKGQVTIFIIIGIVLLLVFAGVLYFMKVTVQTQTSAEGEPIVQSVPTEFQPVQAYTENCLRETGKQGLRLLGQQGGYIHPELVGKYSQANPSESEGLQLGATAVPYWHYKSNLNKEQDNVFSSLQPKLKSKEDPAASIESQLGRFVKEQLASCLNDYQAFAQQGFIFLFEAETASAKATVTEETVNLVLEMPLKAAKGTASATLSPFFVKIPLSLKHYYDVASQITKAQEENRFLERQGLELLSVYSRKDSEFLAPISSTGYKLFSALSWNEPGLKQKMKSLLTAYVPMLQFLGSSNFYYTIYPEGSLLAQRVADNSVITLTGAEDLEVSFDYWNWEPYFKTNSENGVLKPTSAFTQFGPLTFGTQQYETHYDISYPVLVTIRDRSALEGGDYVFTFALEANIRNNAPAPVEKSLLRTPPPVSSLACDPEQRETGLLKTVVVDSYTKEPLEAVRLGFTIPDQAECEVGMTNKQGSVEEKYPAAYGGVINFVKPEYLTNFYPIDTFKLKNQDALIGYAVAEASAAPKVVELDRFKMINVSIKKKNVEKCLTPLLCEYTVGVSAFVLPYKEISCEKGQEQCFFDSGNSILGKPTLLAELSGEGSLSKFNKYYLSSTAADLAENEEAMFFIERVSGFHDEIVSSEHVAAGGVKGNSKTFVQLVPGKYKVSAQLMLHEPVKIPAEDRCFRYDIVTWEKEECFRMEESTTNDYLAGSLQWEVPEAYLVITPEDLYTSNELTLYVPAQNIKGTPEKISVESKECSGLACVAGKCLFDACHSKQIAISGRTVEDLQLPGMLGNLSQKQEIRAQLKPTFK